MSIPRAFIDDLIARIDIIDFIDKRVPLKKQGKDFAACCPFHDEKSPSFHVSQVKQLYHCFGCGAGGNLITFVIEHERVNFPEAVEMLATQLGLEVPSDNEDRQKPQRPRAKQDHYSVLERVARHYRQQLREYATAINYLKQRGLTGEVAQIFSVGFVPEGWHNLELLFPRQEQQHLITTGMLIENDNGQVYDRFRHRIMFPIRDKQGRVIAFGGRGVGDEKPKYLNSPETPLFHKSKELYGLYESLQAEREIQQFFIVEGYMDVIALHQHGIRTTVATLGTATTSQHIQQLWRYCNKVIFCFDGDRAGREAAWRALNTALPLLRDGYQVRFLFLPDGEDPDSMVRQEGKEAFLQRAQQATTLADYFFAQLHDGADIHSMDGKARLISQAGPLIQKIPDAAMRHLMLDQLARIVRIEIDRLKTMIAPLAGTETEPPTQPTVGRSSTIRIAIALLLQNTSLCKTIPAELDLNNMSIAGSDILQKLIENLQANPELNTAQLVEMWRGHKNHPHILNLANWAHMIPDDGIASEFRDVIQGLIVQNIDQQLDSLLRKAAQQELSIEEKQQLQKLIKTSKKIPS